MDIDFYIFNWPRAIHAKQLANDLAGLGRVTVINSGPTVNENWVVLDQEAYFSAQWNEAIRRFKGDILFHIQADAYSGYMREIVDRAVELHRQYDWGIFAPNVDFTPHTVVSKQLDTLVWEVPCTDCTCWAITREVLEAGPAWFPGKLGWGIDLTYTYISQAMKKKVLRDYKYTVWHPRSRHYSDAQAAAEWGSFQPAVLSYVEKMSSGSNPERLVLKG